MRKRKRVAPLRTEPYSEQQLTGLREHFCGVENIDPELPPQMAQIAS